MHCEKAMHPFGFYSFIFIKIAGTYFSFAGHKIEGTNSRVGGIGVNERGLKVLEQYELKIINTRRGRGSFICETDRGLKVITEFQGSQNRLRFQNSVLAYLKEQGYELVDSAIENMQGELVTLDRDETAYIVKDWFAGRECDTKSREDILSAIRNLAKLHKLLRMPQDIKEAQYIGETLAEEYVRRNREIRKVYNFIRGRRRKNEFETCFLTNCSMFLDQAMVAQEVLKASACGALYEEGLKTGTLCHGDYNQHQILNTAKGTATINFAKCRYDIQAGDLYQFMRKILEKQSWNPNMGMLMLEEYDKICSLDQRTREYLKIRLTFPEKFWKLANHYYNHNKAWIPGKNVEKLKILVSQQEKRDAFLKILDL